MHKWYSIFPENPWISIYTWIVFCILPFFFIFKSSSFLSVMTGVALLALFFLSYIFSFKAKSGLVYMWLSFEMLINVLMILLFGFVYFALFTAFFIGNIKHTAGFFIMYSLHIVTTLVAVVLGFLMEPDLLMPQIHFIILSLIGVILLPFHLYNRNKQEKLQGQLEVANEKISKLMIIEERERIARDLHDTLGQKLSLIGLKSDLVGKLMLTDSTLATAELQEIRTTASSALNEVRELVSNMRFKKLDEEIIRVKQILKSAAIDLTITSQTTQLKASPVIENVLSMCLKEAVTNTVKHSQASNCHIELEETAHQISLQISDDGIGMPEKINLRGNGLNGMRERLDFVNGDLEIKSEAGTHLTLTVPIAQKNVMRGEEA